MSMAIESFAQFLALLADDFEVFRYPVLDLVRRYGVRYEMDALSVLQRAEEFALLNGQTLCDGLAFYRAYIEQVAEERRLFQNASRSRQMDSMTLLDEELYQRHYLYALTLSTALNRSRYELFQDYRDAVRQHVKPGSLILEIGAGNCLDAGFASIYGEVHAYEKNQLSRTWQRLLRLDSKIDLRIAEYAFDQVRTYDFVVMIELLEHLVNPAEYLQGMRRVLKDDGLAYLTYAIRMPQIDHLCHFTSIDECRDLIYDNQLEVVRDRCLVDTYMPFEEGERWLLGDDPHHAVIYCCLVRKHRCCRCNRLLDDFNEDLEC